MGEYEVKLKYNENQKVEIEYVDKLAGLRVTYKLNPESYTNGEKVAILLTVNDKVKSVTRPDNLVIYPENEIIAINYQVTANGTYRFVIEDKEGNKQEKNVIVDTIDRLTPNNFEITAENTGDGTTTASLTPKKLEIDNVKFKEISNSNTSVYALDEENSLWAWGGGTGILYGDGSTGRSLMPKKIF